MIKPLRNYHFIIWRILAVLLPVAFILAIFWRTGRKKIQTHTPIESNEGILKHDSIK
jgi:hypothetical protein